MHVYVEQLIQYLIATSAVYGVQFATDEGCDNDTRERERERKHCDTL